MWHVTSNIDWFCTSQTYLKMHCLIGSYIKLREQPKNNNIVIPPFSI